MQRLFDDPDTGSQNNYLDEDSNLSQANYQLIPHFEMAPTALYTTLKFQSVLFRGHLNIYLWYNKRDSGRPHNTDPFTCQRRSNLDDSGRNVSIKE